MTDRVRAFVLETLTEKMNEPVDVDTVRDDMSLGPEGLNLESLAFVELMAHIETEYDVSFEDDELEKLGQLTLGEFCAAVAERATAEVASPE